MRSKEQINEIVRRLEEAYPLAECALEYGKDYELLFAVRLSAQCTDARVNMVTPALYERFPTLESFAEASESEVGEYIHSCGFFHTKAKDIVECAKLLIRDYGGRVPDSMEELLKLPGVGRKTANLILGDVYNDADAVVVDTHCIRITNKLGLSIDSLHTVTEDNIVDCSIRFFIHSFDELRFIESHLDKIEGVEEVQKEDTW